MNFPTILVLTLVLAAFLAAVHFCRKGTGSCSACKDCKLRSACNRRPEKTEGRKILS